jgi:hypothetical protein
MSAGAYRLLGILAWRVGRWYLRNRRPSRRRLLSRALIAGVALLALAVLARRFSG